jgi:hypothetical protein
MTTDGSIIMVDEEAGTTGATTPKGVLCTVVGWHSVVRTLGDGCECETCGGEGVRRVCFTLDPNERATVLVCSGCRHCRRCDGRGAVLRRKTPPYTERPWDRDTATEGEHIHWCPACSTYPHEPPRPGAS